MINATESERRLICKKWGASYIPALEEQIIGVSKNIRQNAGPINGLRHPLVGKTCGWYIWLGGEIPLDDDFFEPLHVKHVAECRPEVSRFLGLAPGWRFLLASDYEDVWFDKSLLEMR